MPNETKNFWTGTIFLIVVLAMLILLIIGCSRWQYNDNVAKMTAEAATHTPVVVVTPSPTRTLAPVKITATYMATMTHIGKDTHIGFWEDPFHPGVVCYWVRNYPSDTFNCVQTGEKE